MRRHALDAGRLDDEGVDRRLQRGGTGKILMSLSFPEDNGDVGVWVEQLIPRKPVTSRPPWVCTGTDRSSARRRQKPLWD